MASRDSASAQQLDADRRQARRKKLHLRADVTLPGDLTIASHTVDLSAGGALIEVPYKLDIGAECTIEFVTAPVAALRGVAIKATVRHCGLRGERFYAGLQFPQQDPQVQAGLESLSGDRLP
ncbi:MAG: PilZ domain-containing protein [Steroidobacteraceae bacterium]